jgi:CheY-like chemotaxis protein
MAAYFLTGFELVPKINFQKLFGESVKIWRQELGISQEELADRADLHRTYISDVERGARNPSLQSITKLARALEVSISSLFPQQIRHEKSGAGHDRKLVDILLVEDDANDEELTLHAFKKARFANKVHVVRDGAEALDYVFCSGKYSARRAGENPQMILLDLKLPKISGLEVLRRIKADKRTATIPVVVLTASRENDDIVQCQRLGAKSYIVKPVDFQNLSEATPGLNLDWGLLKPVETKKSA